VYPYEKEKMKSVILCMVVFALNQLGILANNLEADEIRYSQTGKLSTKM
jgi:hypothetical protein